VGIVHDECPRPALDFAAERPLGPATFSGLLLFRERTLPKRCPAPSRGRTRYRWCREFVWRSLNDRRTKGLARLTPTQFPREQGTGLLLSTAQSQYQEASVCRSPVAQARPIRKFGTSHRSSTAPFRCGDPKPSSPYASASALRPNSLRSAVSRRSVQHFGVEFLAGPAKLLALPIEELNCAEEA
jgi:hypothetical protein